MDQPDERMSVFAFDVGGANIKAADGLDFAIRTKNPEKAATALAATRAGVTGQFVHEATLASLATNGFAAGHPTQQRVAVMSHGTGHGIGLEVHEPPLLAMKAPTLVVGDVLTIEPGLYALGIGGIRVEDMVTVTRDGCENFNTLHEGLDWR